MGALLVLAFLVVPVLEIYLIIQVGQVIGPLWTVLLLILESLLGAWIVRREGARTWRRLRAAVTAGRLPSRELADGALVLIGGTLLLTPGFATDVVGFALVLPFTRAPARRLLLAFIARRARSAALSAAQRPRRGGAFGPFHGPAAGRGTTTPDPRIVPGEVVDDDRDARGN